jgi:hydroxymethylpyrimidine/phosphomethylpyrimidine kinase
MNHKKNVLTIAGSDSSGGAGIQADLKTFEALNTYGASVITSITAQNTLGVQAVYDLPADFVAQQLDSVFSDIEFSAIKIGMLKNQSLINTIADKLKQNKTELIILDPVMVSTSGHSLLDKDAMLSLTSQLFPLAHLITPNIPEAAALLDTEQHWVEENLQQACTMLIETYSLKAVLLKGGHLSGDYCLDTLASRSNKGSIEYSTYKHTKIKTQNTHGTGCSLSSAIAAFMARGESLEKAVSSASKFLQAALRTSDLQNVGTGNGPVNHHSAGMIMSS